MAVKQIKVGGFGVFKFDDAAYPDAIDTTGGPGGDAPIKVANVTLADLTTNVRLIESNANKQASEVDDLTTYIINGSGITVAGSNGTVTISRFDRYGELYMYNAATPQTPVGGSWVKITGFTTGELKNCTVVSNNIRVDYIGVYLLLASFSIYPSVSGAQQFDLLFRKNTTAQTRTAQRVQFTAAEEISITISGIMNLSAADIIDVGFKRTAGSGNMVIVDANFKVIGV